MTENSGGSIYVSTGGSILISGEGQVAYNRLSGHIFFVLLWPEPELFAHTPGLSSAM